MVATAAKRRILVAEDDDASRELITRYLVAKGDDVVAVADGQAVLDTLDGSFDLVLLDVMMPKLTGFEVLEHVRGRGDTTPIIMATAAARAEDVVKALTLGADDYVTKPFSFPVLMARIDLRLRLRPPVAAPAAIEAPLASPSPTPPPMPDATFDASDVIEEVDDAAAAPPVEDTGGILRRIKAVASRLKQGVVRPPVQELAAGTVIADRYVVGDKIGEGGFGVVFRARHMDLEQDVAIKVLRASSGSKAITGFRREAQNASRMRHANAVRVFDFGVLPGSSAYLVMELLVGPSVEELVKKTGKLEVERALPIMRAVLSALASAHKQGLVHRDVKPHNVVLHQEQDHEVPKLLDFGIAKMVDDTGDSGSVIMGSAAYIAPERLRGEAYDGRADVYACGIMFHRVLTGALPCQIPLDDFEKIALWHLHEKPPAAGIKPGVDKVVLRLLEKDPHKRPDAAEAEALVESLVWE